MPTSKEAFHGYCLWQFTKGRWVLKAPRGASGAGLQPPKTPGKYEGEIRRKLVERTKGKGFLPSSS